MDNKSFTVDGFCGKLFLGGIMNGKEYLSCLHI